MGVHLAKRLAPIKKCLYGNNKKSIQNITKCLLAKKTLGLKIPKTKKYNGMITFRGRVPDLKINPQINKL